jgi:hypothetical protein
MTGRLAYIGVKRCGCVTFAQIVEGATPAQLDEVIRSGRRVEKVPVDEADRRLVPGCDCETTA